MRPSGPVAGIFNCLADMVFREETEVVVQRVVTRQTLRASRSEVCGTMVVNNLQKALVNLCWSEFS